MNEETFIQSSVIGTYQGRIAKQDQYWGQSDAEVETAIFRAACPSNISVLLSGIFFMFLLSGCYTQLVALERPHGGLDQVVADYEDNGDVVVRKYYEDGYVDEDVYDEYDWITHQPYGYRDYFTSFYDPFYGFVRRMLGLVLL